MIKRLVRFAVALGLSVAVAGAAAGCAFKQKAMNIKLTEGCTIEISGVAQSNVKDVVEEWEFARNCSLKVDGKAIR